MSRVSPRFPFLAVLSAAAGAVLFGAGCVDHIGPDPWSPVLSPYRALTAPESLLYNLQVSYIRREIEEYARLLAPEFRFKFQPFDSTEFGTAYLAHDPDSAGTAALFASAEVSDIRISLLFEPRDATVNFPGTPLDTLRLFVSSVDLQVDETSGLTWLVTDQQDMFFRRGLTDAGEDATRWFLYEWRDLPASGAPLGSAPRGSEASSPSAARETTWGRLKTQYLD